MRLFGIKNCNSVLKARKFLDARGVEYDFIDLKVDKPQIKDIKKWVEVKGIDKVINSKGSTYRSLGLKNMDLDLSAKIDYCQQNPLLLKRPIIDEFDGDNVIIGFDECDYQKIFGVV